ncbi:hypothetical protein ACFY78_18975 [Streptomyces olindensis]|uniref:hypothetical protein n=1 Tax=Streptomyces olindensis TaxID=358823 RepID=UPI003677766F
MLQQLGDARIDILVLNAGMQTAKAEGRSADGYALTFEVSYLAHYLLPGSWCRAWPTTAAWRSPPARRTASRSPR